MANKRKVKKEEREVRESIRKESKKKQESVLQNLAQFMEEVNKTVDTEPEEIDEIEEFSGFVQEESTTAGRFLADLIYTFTNDFEIGKLVKSGEIRKKVVNVEPEWKAPDGYNMTHFDLESFSMKLLTRAENPRFDKVILQLHGGGYVAKIKNSYYNMATYYCDAGNGISVLSPDYRVAPEDPYPAALEDALASYQWLLERGWKGEQIIVVGDSAGGGLAMALTMYLRDHDMPMPCGLVAMSPWTDVTASGESYTLNYELDPLFGNSKETMIYENDYAGEHDKKDPYISPIYGNFRQFPPMLIQVGSTEMLLSDSITAASMADIVGVDVRLSIYDDMFHVFQMSGKILPEAKKAWDEVEQFLQLLLND
ncbi:MAG: alpha/beta hydrolase [Agathobacter sp.]|nr:alpha/beta hydrolase [Agathobacter sp.]